MKTTYEYGPAGMTKLIAWQSGTIGQQTEYVYGVTTAGGSSINSNDIVGATEWPDKTTGASPSSEQETVTVDAVGEVITSTDRNGSVHTITRDILGRVISDAVTTLASGVDGSVYRIDTAYDSQGNAYLVTSYDAVTGGSIVNQVQRAYNGLGQITDEWQQVGAVVNTSTSPRVQYVWSTLDANNRSRLVAMVYPSGYTVDYNYASGLDSDISRLSSMSDSSGTLESYGYLGAGSMLVRTNGAGVVHTTTLDDLGRVAGVSAVKGSTTLDGYGYTYNRNSNRLTRSNATNSAFDEAYTYDDTNQLTGFTRGSDSKDWGFDALGNRTSVATNGGMPDAWTANAQNQITGINGSTTPTYDLNGNMTGDEQGRTLVYDAWNRLVQVKNGSTLLNAYTYDGGNRKVTEDDDTAVTQLVYSAAWQVLEEKVGSSYTNRYVWSPVYVDALVMRDDGTQRVWAIQDANWNVTALVDDSGNVLERIGYDDPYGKVTVYDASWNVKSGGSGYAWEITYQGMRYDETPGLFLQRMRWYSPTLGRWTSNDMLQFAAGDMNLYRMVANNPTNQLDPSGLESWSVDHTQGKITVKMYVNFKFESWERSDGKQEWTKERKEAFIQKFKSEVEAGWNSPKNGNFVLELSKDEMMKKGNYDTLAPNRNAPHRIKLKYNTRYTAVLVIEESSFGSDFVVNVKANPKPAVFCRSKAEVGGDYAYLDEDDVNVSSGGQISAVHEFGHLLGYGHPGIDPLRPDREDYGKDWDSLMGGGTEMRPDYYSKWATKLSKTTGQNVTVVHYK